METATLYRQNETLWSFRKGNQEIRLLTPGFRDRADDYLLANKVKGFLLSLPTLGNWVAWECPAEKQGSSSKLLGRWQVCDVTEEEYRKLQSESLIYKRDFENPGVRVFRIEPISYRLRISLFFERLFPGDPPLSTKMALPYNPQNPAAMFFQAGPFRDPFTRLSEHALQRYDTPFVSEQQTQGSYHFTLEDGILYLRHNSRLSLSQGTTEAVTAFRDYLRKSFEWRTVRNTEEGLSADLRFYPETFDLQRPRSREDQFLGYLKETFGIDFDAMLKNGEPLLADHVFKCNIAAAQVDMAYLESLYGRITGRLKGTIAGDPALPLPTSGRFYQYLKGIGIDRFFSLKELEGIHRSFIRHCPERTLGALRNYLDSFGPIRSAPSKGFHNITPESLHRLMEISSIESDALFTGRKITHLAISGYKTMGDRIQYDPTRNLFELLHIYPDLKIGSLISHTELLAHVAAKKAMHQCYPAKGIPSEVEWRVGRLIPYPNLEQITRWYYVDGYLNDGKGDVNYILIPASKGYLETTCSDDLAKIRYAKRAPLIKLYRSTASDPEAESSTDSLLADLNPKRVGSLDFDRGDQYERPYFQRCTMPVWAGYLALRKIDRAAPAFLEALSYKNRKDPNANGKEENLIEFLAWQGKMSKGEAKRVYTSFKKRIGEEALRTFFAETSAGAEWAKPNKTAQDIYFAGHSLGAALSQNALFHFGPKEGRIPLAGCQFKCFAFDPPGGMTRKDNEEFLEFGRKHKELLKALGQKWEILFQCEYQDFVPQGGSAWLGVSNEGLKDSEWLDIKGTLFKPLSSAQSKEITTLPSHGRRFRLLNKEEAAAEYEALPLSVQELNSFKNAYWLPIELRLKFGFYVTTPRLTEAIRHAVGGTLLFSMIWMKKKWEDYWAVDDNPKKDGSGVTFYQLNRTEETI